MKKTGKEHGGLFSFFVILIGFAIGLVIGRGFEFDCCCDCDDDEDIPF